MIRTGPRVAVSVERTAYHASSLQRVASSITAPYTSSPYRLSGLSAPLNQMTAPLARVSVCSLSLAWYRSRGTARFMRRKAIVATGKVGATHQ
jgi:hypothetical protein